MKTAQEIVREISVIEESLRQPQHPTLGLRTVFDLLRDFAAATERLENRVYGRDAIGELDD
jgi:hypothetical protein